MSTLRKIELVFLSVLIACLVFMGWRNHQLGNKVDELQLQIAPSAATAKSSQVKAAGIERVTTEREAAYARLDESLKANPDYSSTPVPESVANSLRSPTGAARGVP